MSSGLAFALALATATVSIHADVTFVLTPAVQDGARSNTVVFTGTVSNTDPTNDVYLNDLQFSFTSAATNYLAGDSNAFFANVPGILLPGETYSDVVCAVAIDAATPPGDYSGSVTMVGGTNIFDATALANQTFQVSVFDTPFAVWRFEQFGANTNNPAISGETADPDSDGIVNLLEYALNLDPDLGSVTGLPTPQIDPACGCLTLTYTKVLGASDLIYTPEAADGPGGPWNTNGVAEVIIDADTVAQTIKASDTGSPVASATNRFFHLRITRLP
ncbi:MAG TPA: hypothetical protein VL486_00080 [Verrucomicrobiae bacterium]|nr:hypothetical protein [Verrucomicrobiae bacterium]